ncbi:TPA: hypothetical protein N0F65_012380 [Lagenidium giganteum]|uniref:DUF2306 domain-containing protein n=1 Tax=Lagenidium giganteum TaxID=4803 RepID=A0AAV2YQB6_9STRA|nr:TPA: hypothetical protein N0F65_012380 [Lagenidium giganteum]
MSVQAASVSASTVIAPPLVSASSGTAGGGHHHHRFCASTSNIGLERTVTTRTVGTAALVGVGLIILYMPKGTRRHKVAGRVWSGAAVLTALTSFRWRDANGSLSWVHGLSALSVYAVGAGIYYARQKNHKQHLKHMRVAVVSAAVGSILTLAIGLRPVGCGSCVQRLQLEQSKP